jgi:hypothetical protein
MALRAYKEFKALLVLRVQLVPRVQQALRVQLVPRVQQALRVPQDHKVYKE